MKRMIGALGMLGAVAGAIGPSPALATGCSASAGYAALDATALETTLNGNTACYPAGGPPWTNQEYHQNSSTTAGNIIDYKQGPTDPKDPTKQVGSYTITTGSGGAIVTYTYGSSTYQYVLWGASAGGINTDDLCTPSAALVGQAKIIAGSGKCG